MPQSSSEYLYALAWTNQFNRWVGRHQQRSLTTAQVRRWGIIYMIGGMVDIPVAAFLAIQLLKK